MKQLKLMTILFAGLFGLMSQAANAALIDQGDTTFDDVNNLEWLDLSFTDSMSINAAASAYTADGWRVANQTEVLSMIDSLFPGYSGLSGTADLDFATFDPVATEFAALMGITGGSTSVDYIYGMYLDGANVEYSGIQHTASLVRLHRDITTTLLTTTDSSLGTMGVYMVRDVASVPEASSLAMFAFGLLGLGFARRRKA